MLPRHAFVKTMSLFAIDVPVGKLYTPAAPQGVKWEDI